MSPVVSLRLTSSNTPGEVRVNNVLAARVNTSVMAMYTEYETDLTPFVAPGRNTLDLIVPTEWPAVREPEKEPSLVLEVYDYRETLVRIEWRARRQHDKADRQGVVLSAEFEMSTDIGHSFISDLELLDVETMHQSACDFIRPIIRACSERDPMPYLEAVAQNEAPFGDADQLIEEVRRDCVQMDDITDWAPVADPGLNHVYFSPQADGRIWEVLPSEDGSSAAANFAWRSFPLHLFRRNGEWQATTLGQYRPINIMAPMDDEFDDDDLDFL